ncbi:HlyD family secretion protein [Labrys okinawensis]|uniref:HlyD family secretion protein n=1 Tax=Labrys okinawensis TaxID=346911 RepID=UPI0039BC6318
MAALLLLAYAAICVVIFKLLRVPVNKWTVTTSIIGGFVIIGSLITAMNYNHPFTTLARLYFHTTPIIPEVKGRVIDVPVQPNTPLKAGATLFVIEPKPYQFVVDQKEAALTAAQQSAKQLQTELDQASAAVAKAQAQVALSQQTFDRQSELFQQKDVAQATVDTAARNLEAARQSLNQAQAGQERARLAATSQINGVNTTVAQLAADLRDARYNLEQTTVRAPTDGYVTQLFLRPGMMAGTTPAMVFIHADDRIFTAAFPQNVVQRIRPGEDAEIAFDAIPGRVFAGKVRSLVDAVSQGQLQAASSLLDPEDRAAQGMALVVIDITADLSRYELPAGATAQVAIYSDHLVPIAVIRRILLRMKSWLNYLI